MIKLKGFKEENMNDYKKISMFLAMPNCDFKCLKEKNLDISICQNSHLNKEPIQEYDIDYLINIYLNNNITEAIVFGGLEPMLDFEQMLNFIKKFRDVSNDDIVIYTGYYEDEIKDKIEILKEIPNIIVKFGRFEISEKKYDDVLGIALISKNQYAKKIS